MYDATVGRFLSEDPIGFAGGDANLSRYVGNEPVDSVDPDGLAKRKWMLHLHDHGGPHVQLGHLRWSAFDFHPLEHNKVIPPRLCAKDLEELRQAGIWDRILKNVEGNNIEQVARDMLEEEMFDEMRRRGTKRLSKKTAKEIAEETLRRSPLVLLIIAIDSRDAYADAQRRGASFAVCNQMLPIELTEDLVGAASARYDIWFNDFKDKVDRRRFGSVMDDPAFGEPAPR